MIEESAAIEGRARERVIRWSDPHASAELARSMSGLDAMRAIKDGRIPAPPIGTLMNMWLAEVDDGRVVFEAEPGEYHYNPIGIVHGGFALTLADSSLGCAVYTKLPAGIGYGSTDVQLRFIRPITMSTGVVRCEAHAIHVGRTTGIAEAKLTDRAGKLLAVATTACAIFRP